MSKPTTTALAAPIAPSRPSALSAMAARFDVDPKNLLETLKNTAFKGANDAQMMALCIVANEHGLNPFTKEIYAFPDSKSGGIVPVIGVDGWLRKMNDYPEFDGLDTSFENDGNGKVVSCTATIHRKDRAHPTVITEYVEECKRNTDPWNKQPRRMIRHRAIIQCIRVAFGLAGTDPEDAERMRERDVTPEPPPFLKPKLPKLAAVQAEPVTEPDPAPTSYHEGLSDTPEGWEPGEDGKEGK